MNCEMYRSSSTEQQRIADLLELLPRGRRSILEIGSRDGYHTRLLTQIFDSVTALDLEKPQFDIPRVVTVEGDVTQLDFPDRFFDSVLCAEVLEHVPNVERAAREITRVARHEVVVGVPYKQDLRVSRLTCDGCGAVNPPFGHVNTFDEHRLRQLFSELNTVATHWVGKNELKTNAVSVRLMDFAGNPWGTYGQEEPCQYCGAIMSPPVRRSLPQKVAGRLAHTINQLQRPFVRATANWIHMLFRRAR